MRPSRCSLLFIIFLLQQQPADGGGGERVTDIPYPAPAPWHVTIDAVHPNLSADLYLLPVQAPGDSIGMTTFDYLTNGSAPQSIVGYGEGAPSVARTMATDDHWTDLGSYFRTLSGGWEGFSGPIENPPRAWTGITQIESLGGLEVLCSARGDSNDICVDAGRGANLWTCSSIRAGYWPRIAAGSDLYLHVIACDSNPPSQLDYFYSPDAGGTWSVVTPLFPGTNSRIDADGYDIAARGSSVAVLCAGQGGDVVLKESSDNGATWTEEILYDAAGPGELPYGETEWQPDGACSLVYDGPGNLHAVWSNFLALGNTEGNPVLYYSTRAGLIYWNETDGLRDIDPPVTDPNLQPPLGRDGNFTSQPDFASSWDGGLILIYSQIVSEQDRAGRNYQHIFGTCLNYFNFGPGDDLTPGTGFDASFAAIPNSVHSVYDEVSILYNADPYPGNAVSGNHPLIPVTVRELSTRVQCLIPGEGSRDENKDLMQNTPNPFNPRTEIVYSVRTQQQVRLRICDLLGREVALLVNERKEPGTYRITWDATNHSSGVYLYQLITEGTVLTRKMILLK